MSKHRLQRAIARNTLSIAFNRPIPLTPTLNGIEPRHLLRALLRQCTYLPDAKARDFFHCYIVNRYRKYSPRQPNPPNGPTLTPIRRRMLVKEAFQGLRFLQRANDGHPDRLLRVLAMTYGRTGKMRRELMRTVVVSKVPVKSDPSPTNEIALAQMSESMTKDYINSQLIESLSLNLSQRRKKPRSRKSPVLGPQLTALVNSQKQLSESRFPKHNVKEVEPSIPEKNSWGRPMPQCRVANMKDRWYASLLDRVMPPLSEEDWNRLRDLALGRLPWEGPIKRRASLAQTKVENLRLTCKETCQDQRCRFPSWSQCSLIE